MYKWGPDSIIIRVVVCCSNLAVASVVGLDTVRTMKSSSGV